MLFSTTTSLSCYDSASEMTYIVSSGALNSTHSLAQLLRENVSFLHSPTPTNASVGDCFSTLLLQPLYNNKIMLGLFSFSL